MPRIKLLVIVRKVDAEDSLMGFFVRWLTEMSERVSELHVITWQASNSHNLPSNVSLYAIDGRTKALKVWSLIKLLAKLIPTVDRVYCHMNPEYTIVAAPIARFFGKKVVSWYAHGSLTWKVRLMERLTHKVVTSSRQGFGLASNKLTILHQGIDTDSFVPGDDESLSDAVRLLTIGRISPTKNLDIMIEAVSQLVDSGNNVNFSVIGQPGLVAHQAYFDRLKDLVHERRLGDRVHFHGPKTNSQVVSFYQGSDIFLNASMTGSLDKTVLEAMSCGCIPLTSNPAYQNIVPSICYIGTTTADSFAQRIREVQSMSIEQRRLLRQQLRDIVVRDHNLHTLIEKIINVITVA